MPNGFGSSVSTVPRPSRRRCRENATGLLLRTRRRLYNWGALTLHALRIEIGDEAFFETLRTYVADYRDSVVATADFVAVAERVAGRDLSELFDTWLFSESVPELPTSAS